MLTLPFFLRFAPRLRTSWLRRRAVQPARDTVRYARQLEDSRSSDGALHSCISLTASLSPDLSRGTHRQRGRDRDGDKGGRRSGGVRARVHFGADPSCRVISSLLCIGHVVFSATS